jgi:hypothetical protein
MCFFARPCSLIGVGDASSAGHELLARNCALPGYDAHGCVIAKIAESRVQGVRVDPAIFLCLALHTFPPERVSLRIGEFLEVNVFFCPTMQLDWGW